MRCARAGVIRGSKNSISCSLVTSAGAESLPRCSNLCGLRSINRCAVLARSCERGDKLLKQTHTKRRTGRSNLEEGRACLQRGTVREL